MTPAEVEDTTVDEKLEAMAAVLERSGHYRILRRLAPLSRVDVAADAEVMTEPTGIGLFLDVETTGLDPRRDEVIELAMVRFRFTTAGRIVEVGETYDRLRQPSDPIPPFITRLTGITDARVAGKVIDADEVARFLRPADLVIAHNAKFDRKFAERLHPAFISKRWACSMTQALWCEHGYEGVKLAYLLMSAGLFHGSHRALDDCHAALALLSRSLGDTGRSALAHVLDAAFRTMWRLRAAGAPYKHKDWLRSRGYRWNNGEDGQLRAWFIDLAEDAVDAEVEALRAKVFGPGWKPPITSITALNRFSDRV